MSAAVAAAAAEDEDAPDFGEGKKLKLTPKLRGANERRSGAQIVGGLLLGVVIRGAQRLSQPPNYKLELCTYLLRVLIHDCTTPT